MVTTAIGRVLLAFVRKRLSRAHAASVVVIGPDGRSPWCRDVAASTG
jgi:hypothetical protein